MAAKWLLCLFLESSTDTLLGRGREGEGGRGRRVWGGRERER